MLGEKHYQQNPLHYHLSHCKTNPPTREDSLQIGNLLILRKNSLKHGNNISNNSITDQQKQEIGTFGLTELDFQSTLVKWNSERVLSWLNENKLQDSIHFFTINVIEYEKFASLKYYSLVEMGIRSPKSISMVLVAFKNLKSKIDTGLICTPVLLPSSSSLSSKLSSEGVLFSDHHHHYNNTIPIEEPKRVLIERKAVQYNFLSSPTSNVTLNSIANITKTITKFQIKRKPPAKLVNIENHTSILSTDQNISSSNIQIMPESSNNPESHGIHTKSIYKSPTRKNRPPNICINFNSLPQFQFMPRVDSLPQMKQCTYDRTQQKASSTYTPQIKAIPSNDLKYESLADQIKYLKTSNSQTVYTVQRSKSEKISSLNRKNEFVIKSERIPSPIEKPLGMIHPHSVGMHSTFTSPDTPIASTFDLITSRMNTLVSEIGHTIENIKNASENLDRLEKSNCISMNSQKLHSNHEYQGQNPIMKIENSLPKNICSESMIDTSFEHFQRTDSLNHKTKGSLKLTKDKLFSEGLKRLSVCERPPSTLIQNQLQVFFPSMKSDALKKSHSILGSKSGSTWTSISTSFQSNKNPVEDIKDCDSLIHQYCGNEKFTCENQANRNQVHLNDETDPLYQYCDLDSPLIQTDIPWIKSYLIGKGSFGKVYLGLDLNSNTFLAIKQVDTKFTALGKSNNSNNKHFVKMVRALHSEVELMKELCHENIVQYKGFDFKGGIMSLLMEYVSGGSVASLICKRGQLPQPVCLNILNQTMKGLSYLHQHVIIHRDVKSANS